ncbi:MAG: hypothetical protein ACRYFR_13510 [Janthinobacterium lividum]
MTSELLEALAHFDAITTAGFSQLATSPALGQRPQTTASTFFLYGYLIGENTDTLLCGHPDLAYWSRPRGPAATFAA